MCRPVSNHGARIETSASRLATLSYSLYLSHKIVFHLTQKWLGGPGAPANGPVMMFLCLGLAVGFALLMHHAIERPAFRLRDWLLARRSAGMAASSEPRPSVVARWVCAIGSDRPFSLLPVSLDGPRPRRAGSGGVGEWVRIETPWSATRLKSRASRPVSNHGARIETILVQIEKVSAVVAP